MRRLVLIPVLAALLLPGAAGAATVQARDFDLRPSYTRIEPGEAVTWTFAGSPHDVASRAGAPVPFDSGEKLPGETFSFTFATAGRYPYHCTLHPIMRGVVQVGPDTVDPELRRPRATVGRRSVRVSFRLSEGSTVSATIASTKKPRKALRRIRARRFETSGSLTTKRAGLAPGRYRVTLTARDPEGNAGTARVAFRIPA